ncbi:MAG TPA: amino acid adenylation domain-containing protein [Herpetosiphonaceae bacterium]
MTTVEFLAQLHDLGVKLWAEGERLRYRGSKEVLTPGLLKELSSRKADLLVLLRATAPQSSIPRATLDGPPPLSFAQQRLWFLDQLLPNTAIYNLPIALRLTGALDVAALAETLSAIVRRHQVLRTTFASQGPGSADRSEPVQVIAPPAPHPLNVVELHPEGTRLPADEREAAALRLVEEELERPFDLERGPLLRTMLLRLSPTEHILLLTLHHIISDAWSMGVLVREVAALYPSYAGQAAPLLPELPIQYADYAIWQRQWLQGEQLDREIDYWRRQLAAAPSLLDLPLDRPRPAVQSYRGAVHSVRLPDLLPDLRAVSEREGATLFMTLLASFYSLLHRYSGQTDLLVGSPIANRTRAELEGLIGFFVNTLVLRADLSGKPRFRDLLQQVRRVTLDAYAHQDVPFEKLVEVLQPERDMSHTPFFQVMFVLQNAPIDALELPGLTLSPVPFTSSSAKFDLTILLTESESELIADIEYNTDLFDAATIVRMAAHFQSLLRAIVADPDARIAHLPLLTEAERQRMLIDWNRSEAEYPRAAAVHALIEAQAACTPDVLALVFDGQALSYAELNTRANQLAHYLRAQGVGPDVLVALCVERSLEMIAGMLAILKAGGAYVPLDPTYPAERLQYMLSHSRSPVILTQAALVARLPEHTAQVFRLDADWHTLAQQPTTNPPRVVLPDQLAYIIFTSGSTGKPKGVMVTQRGLINLVYGLRAYFDDPQVQRTGLITSISFDISVNQIFPTLIFGRTLHVIPDAVKLDSRALLRYLDAHAIHLLDAVPSYMHAVLNEVAPEQPPNVLRYLLIGGEKLEPRLLQAVFGQIGSTVAIVNIYGLTEISDINALGIIRAHDLGQPITVGRPLQNNRIYILDQHHQPQPIGSAGEVCIAGESVSRGYVFRPDLTAERFVPCPFENGQIMVRTGDLGRWRADGTIEILGRIDHQVKVRGFRIETGEIEAVLAKHPDIDACVVVAREDGAGALGARRLVAYMVEHKRDEHQAPHSPSPVPWERGPGGEGRNTKLRAFLAEHLPDYMIPSAFVVLDVLPKTPNGKIDRKALPVPEQQAVLDERFAAPTNPIEDVLASIWADVLGVERVSIHHNFFELGGHSLLATQVIARVRDALQADVLLRDLFETLTVAGLARRIDAARQRRRLPIPPVEPVDRMQPLPLSFGQQRFWFLDRLLPGSPAYSITLGVRLTGRLDRAALQRSLEALVRRHESLRTIFVQQPGKPDDEAGALVQVIMPAAEVALPLLDLGATTAEERVRQTESLLAAEAERPFNLSQGPLLRTTLVRHHDEEHVLLLALHHIITDGWSMNILVRELATLYRGFSQQEDAQAAPVLPELPVQYADYAIWQRQWLAEGAPGGVLDAEMAYWKKQLSGTLPVLQLPLDRPRPAVQSARGSSETLVLSRALTDALKALSRHEGATLFMTLLTAFDVLLHRYTGQTDLLVGSPIAGRIRPELEGVIGLFLNTLVIRADLMGAPSFSGLLAQVRDTTLAAFDHQALPFERLVEELQPERDLSHTPVFQVMFNLLNFADVVLDLPDLQLSVIEPPPPAKFDLTLTLAETPDGLVADFGYNVDLFEAATIARMAAQFEVLLAGIVADPSRRITALPLLPEAEREQVVYAWNPLPSLPPQERLTAQLFEAQAARTPESAALVCGDAVLTYAELNARSNQLARYLRQQGVGSATRETLVGLLVERSVTMVVAVLAILKAGGAYVPLDPAQPGERLQLMLDDAQIDLLLIGEGLAAYLEQPAQRPRFNVVNLDAEWPLIDRQRADNLPIAVHPDQLAYVMYTSGSTGTPKGVGVPHRAMTNYVRWMQQSYPLMADDRVLQTVPLSFDVSIREIFWPLLSGAQLVLARPGGQSDSAYLVEAIERWSITQIRFVPPMLQIFLDAPDLARCPTLRRIFCGGESLPVALQERFFARLDAALLNTYGPTEAAVNATAWTCAPEAAARFVPLGQPVANVQVYLLDANLQPVPIGVAGELCIGGVGLARGYLGRPDLTAARFVPDPFGAEPGGRLYRSGDLARRHADGRLEFVGRIDGQVKLRGFRIELGEIEAVLRQHEAVSGAVVMLRAEPEPRLVAYVVQNQERVPAGHGHPHGTPRLSSPQELRQFLGEHLPEYMIPSAFVALDRLPLTPNGKLDRKALPPPDPALSATRMAYAAPQTPTEIALAAIWAEVLGVERIGLHDHFFELGGHSMLALQVISRVRQTLQVEVPVSTLFTTPTVAALAQHIDVIQWAATSRAAVTQPTDFGEEGDL